MSNWLANKGAGPWGSNGPPFDISGPTPWPFNEQARKLGYINNPRWTASPASDVEHEPCGYWWRERALATLLTNVYAHSRDIGFWGASFDGTSLRYIGRYNGGSGHWFSTPTRYENSLLMTRDIGDLILQPTLQRVSLSAPHVVEQTYSPFLANDIADKIPFRWGPGLVNGKYYLLQGSSLTGVASGAYVGSNFVRFNSSLGREARGYWCTVVTGTDGNLYSSITDLIPTDVAWDATRRPITGAFWPFEWKLHPDMICDSPITPWGSGHVYSGACGRVEWTYGNGKLYVVSAGGPTIGLRKLDPNTFAILSTNGAEANPFDTTKGGHHPVFVNGKIYVVNPVSDNPNYVTVKAYDATTLSLVATSANLIGWGSFGLLFTGIIEGPGYLVCWVETGNGQWALHKLDYASLATIASYTITLPATGVYPPNQLELGKYSAEYLLAIYYRGIGVLRTSTMTLEQPIDLIPQGWVTNLNVEGILSTDVQASTSSPVPLVSPVWTMPA